MLQISQTIDVGNPHYLLERPTRNSSSLDFSSSKLKSEGNGLLLREDNPSSRELDNSASSFLERVKEGLNYHQPELSEEGVNGAYFLRNRKGQRIAVFKPIDEEGNNDNNPKKGLNEDDAFVNKGILPGEGAQREVAAYLLDGLHFHSVPKTIMAALNLRSSNGNIDEKIGSLQEFIENDGSAEDIGPKQFKVIDVHKIGVLDLRIFNTDRHCGNILVKKEPDGSFGLIPIDQALSLPSSLEHSWFEWLYWPQAKIPFEPQTRSFIRYINVDEDAALLKSLGIRPECIRTMKISSTLLKKGAAAGLTLYEIGSMASRTAIDQPSPLEKMFEQAIKETQEKDETSLLNHLWRLMDAEIALKVGERCPSLRVQESERNHIARKNAV